MRVLMSRTDGMGDVLLAGPAARAVHAAGAHVTMLASPAGRDAAGALHGVDDVIVDRLPWIDAFPQRVGWGWFSALVAELAARQFDLAVILTSFHQSPLPLALMCRLAGVARVAAISDEYPGSLLDVRHHVHADVHEVERNLSLVGALGFLPAPSDDRALSVKMAEEVATEPGLVAVHPGATAPARTLSPDRWRSVVHTLVARGHRVVVTGGPDEQALTARVTSDAPAAVWDAGGARTLRTTAEILARAEVVVTGNTGPAHLAAAVGTPVVSVYAPTVPLSRWRPWGVPYVALGLQAIECRGCRARVCPLDEQRCLADVQPDDVAHAVTRLQHRAGAAA